MYTMAMNFLYLLLLTPSAVYCASAAVHSHNHLDSNEKESDGAYRQRDYDHYSMGAHNVEFDHEAIIGSVKEAEEYDKLTPDESRRRLGLLLPKMDLNGDQFIDRKELKQWILNSFINLSREEAQERLQEADSNRDGIVTWQEYLRDVYGVNTEEDIGPDDTGDTGMLVREERAMWQQADRNNDGVLDIEEFVVFINPEEHEEMHSFLENQTLREKDKNNDGLIDFAEYIGDRGLKQDKEWLIAEREKFEHELDADRDGALDRAELRAWIIPDNEEIADEEVEHLFLSADDDHDGRLAFPEVLHHHHVFVGSEATDYGEHLFDERFDDEL
ncbi:reticulocalbin-2 [Epargyreus clarus]|uniref:reticulocalbin-2 n=1 Tax=Epargyreus clarus TaxID=520877 RepID=UPI003C2F352B